MTEQSAQERWEELHQKRNSILKRARDCARLTIPGLLPPEGHNENMQLPTPHQGFGARGVNNLASKLLLALMPPNQTFFKIEPDPKVARELEAADKNALTKVTERLSKIEQSVLSAIETSGDRITVFEALRHLIVVGDVMLYMPNKGGIRMYRLDQFVVRRDRMGHVLEVIIREVVAPETLDPKTRRACQVDQEGEDGKAKSQQVEVYTRVRRKGEQWKVNQEINKIGVPGSAGHYPLNEPAFLPLRWTAVSNEDYGRSLVEEYLGDIRSLEGLSQSINEFAANAAKILWLTNPNGLTDAQELNEAESGEFVSGVKSDIEVLAMDKFPDFRIVRETADNIEKRLQQSFLLTASVQRQAERVTAYEVQVMARELEDALGGVYSVLSQEFQLPYIKRKLVQLQRSKDIPQLPEGAVNPKVTTGLEALGRGHDLAKLNGFLQNLAQLPEPVVVQVMQRLNVNDLVTRLATAHGLNMTGLMKSEDQIQQEQQQQQMAQFAQEAGPGIAQEAVKQAGQSNQQ